MSAKQDRWSLAEDVKAKFIGYQWVVVAVVCLAYVFASWRWHGLLAQIKPETRSLLYVTLASVAGVLLGFGLTAIAIFTGLSSGRGMDFLRGTPGFRYTRTVFMGAIWPYAVTVVLMPALVVADSQVVSNATGLATSK